MFDIIKKILSVFAVLFFVVALISAAVLSLAFNIWIKFTTRQLFQK